MEKYKICPACGKHNTSTMLECLFCETDLTGVRILDKETEEMLNQPVDAPAPAEETEMVRICEECGAINRVSDRKCVSCGEDISDIIPVPRTSSKNTHAPQFILSSVDGAYAYQITENTTDVGRECEMKEYLQDKRFVSRMHARFILDGDKLVISNLSSTNYTFVNNERISGDQQQLHDGDEIGLGGYAVNGERQSNAAYFVVRIGSCT